MALDVAPLAVSACGGVGVVEGARMGQVTYCPVPEKYDVSEMGDVCDTPKLIPAGRRHQGQSAHPPQLKALPLSCCLHPMTAAPAPCGTAAACSGFLLLASHDLLAPSQAENHVPSLAAAAGGGCGGGRTPRVLHQLLVAGFEVADVFLGTSPHVKHELGSVPAGVAAAVVVAVVVVVAAAGGGSGGGGMASRSVFHPG